MFAEKLKHEPLKKIQKKGYKQDMKKGQDIQNMKKRIGYTGYGKGYENGIQTIIPVSENGFIRI